MITVHKGNAEDSETFRLIVACDQCHTRVTTDVPLHNIRDQGDAATEPYLTRAREELGQSCPHIQEELDRQAHDAHPSQQDIRSSSPPQGRYSYNGGS